MSQDKKQKAAETKARNALNKFRAERASLSEQPAPLEEILEARGFGSFKFAKLQARPDAILPHISLWDADTLNDMQARFWHMDEKLKKVEPVKRVHLPTGLANDIYNLYLTPPSAFKFVESTGQNEWRINLLTNLSHYYMRALTQHHPLYSYIVCEELSKALLIYLNPKKDDGKSPEETAKKPTSSLPSKFNRICFI